MERKNTILLTVIAVATLLVAVVGATFAYFTATNGTSGNAATSTVTTSPELDSVTLVRGATSKTEDDDLVIYPGRMIYVGTSVGATVQGSGSYTVTYDLTAKVDLDQAFTKGTVTYYLYRTTEAETTPVSCEDVENEAGTDGVHYSISCSKGTKLTGDSEGSGSLVKTGTVSATNATVTLEDETVNTGSTNYYYLVVEYQNDPATAQDDDKEKTITASFEEVEIKQTAVKAG